MHDISPTNATLFRCNLCDQKQTLNHLFVSCPDVQTFWQSFSCWWNVENDDFIDLNDKTIIYGFTNDFSQQLGLNLCLIITKYYMYCASRDGENYYFEAFLAYLKSKLSIEKSKCKSQTTFSMPIKISTKRHVHNCVCFCFHLLLLCLRSCFFLFFLYRFAPLDLFY